jgi:tRNA A-37 threonylcarbamoyl transferase component Bud32
MAFVDVNPRYRGLFDACGLADAGQFLALPGVVVSGHPDRHVLRVAVGAGPSAVGAFLKREHRVPWKERLLNTWSGFGGVSKSQRESLLLRQATARGLPCPEWMASGENETGRAFLLVREVEGARDLPTLLRAQDHVEERRRLARRVGAAVAHLHEAGFDHPDLYAKHVLIAAADGRVCLLDWQRSRRRRCLGWRRWRDLAVLDATLADALATPRERLACLQAYLDASPSLTGDSLRDAVALIRRHRERLLTLRRIRQVREASPAGERQHLVWLDGEAVCATLAFLREWTGPLPDWYEVGGGSFGLYRRSIALRGPRRATLRTRCAWRPWNRLLARLRGRRVAAPEVRQAGILFRLQRRGVPTPRLLAFGERAVSGGATQSFLLTESPPGTVPLTDWLGRAGGADRSLAFGAASLLRRLHEAGCYLDQFGRGGACPFAIYPDANGNPVVAVDGCDRLRVRRPGRRRALRDLTALRRQLSPYLTSKTSRLRLLLAYLGESRLPAGWRRFARRFLARTRGLRGAGAAVHSERASVAVWLPEPGRCAA